MGAGHCFCLAPPDPIPEAINPLRGKSWRNIGCPRWLMRCGESASHLPPPLTEEIWAENKVPVLKTLMTSKTCKCAQLPTPHPSCSVWATHAPTYGAQPRLCRWPQTIHISQQEPKFIQSLQNSHQIIKEGTLHIAGQGSCWRLSAINNTFGTQYWPMQYCTCTMQQCTIQYYEMQYCIKCSTVQCNTI